MALPVSDLEHPDVAVHAVHYWTPTGMFGVSVCLRVSGNRHHNAFAGALNSRWGGIPFLVTLLHTGTLIAEKGSVVHHLEPYSLCHHRHDQGPSAHFQPHDHCVSWMAIGPISHIHLKGLGVIHEDQPHVTTTDPAGVLAHMEAIAACKGLNYGPGWGQVLGHICALYDFFASHRTLEPPPLWLTAARDLLGNRLPSDLTLSDVARRLGIRSDTFRHEFRRHVGVAPMAYRTQCRIDSARNLLLSHGVEETARMLGYSSAKSFSRLFRKMVGASPSDYQSERQSGASNS